MDLRLTQCPCVKAASWAHALESASLCVQRRWSSGNLLWLEHSRFEKQFSVAHKKSITALWFGFFALFCHSRCQRVYMMRGAHFSRRPWSVRREMRTRSTSLCCRRALVHYCSFSYQAIWSAHRKETPARAPTEQFAQKREMRCCWWLMRIFHQLFRACRRLAVFNGFGVSSALDVNFF